MPPVELVQIGVLGACVLASACLTFLCVRGWHPDRYLCGNCKYNSPETCSKPERPKASRCMAYAPKQQPPGKPPVIKKG